MKKTIFILLLGLVFLASIAFGQVKVSVRDANGKTVLENFLTALSYTGSDNTMIIILRDPVSEKKVKIKLNGVETEVTDIDMSISTATAPVPVSPTPTPTPTVKPSPPFPLCWWGPKPSDKSELVAYIDGGGAEVQGWADWLKANPGDLDWAWAEYKKVNP